MQNNFSESIKKKIQDEAEDFYRSGKALGLPGRSGNQMIGCYEAGAAAVISNPGEYGLAGVWVKASEKPPEKDSYVPVRYNYNERDGWLYSGMSGARVIKNADFYEDFEWLDSSPPLPTE